MIDAKEYNLVYLCKTTKEKFPAKRLEGKSLAVFKDGEVKVYTAWEARLNFVASRLNKKNKTILSHTRPLLAPRIKISTRKKYEEYLNESDEKLVSGLY